MNLDAKATVRRAVLGTRSAPRRLGAAAGAGLFAATGLIALVSQVAFDVIPEALLWLFVLLGVLLAIGMAYGGGGLLASAALVFGPVYGPLAVCTWLISTRQVAPVAFVLSFYGHGAPALWTPIAVVLVAGSYGLGALGRRAANRVETR